MIPLFLTILGLSDQALQIFGYLSGICLMVGGVISV
jgi:hypothetical protein